MFKNELKMGNFKNLKLDFVRRTLAVIEQYDEFKDMYDFNEQYNHTLLINCLLGLAILPKEKIIRYVPREKIQIVKHEQGFPNSNFDTIIKDTSDLIAEIRDSSAHFNLRFVSNDDNFLIDRIQFINDRLNRVVADFQANELPVFVRWFANQLIDNFEKYGEKEEN